MVLVGHLIYGIPFTKELHEKLQEWRQSEERDEYYLELADKIEDSFVRLPLQNAIIDPGYMGVTLKKIYSSEATDLHSLEAYASKWKDTKEINNIFEIYHSWPVQIRELVGKVGFYIVWSSI